MTDASTTSRPLFNRQQLISLFLPLVAEQALSISIGLADTLMVSSVGEAAVSGVSLVDSFNVLMIQLLSALATGGAVVPQPVHRPPGAQTGQGQCRPDHVHYDLAQRGHRRHRGGGAARHPAGHLRLH